MTRRVAHRCVQWSVPGAQPPARMPTCFSMTTPLLHFHGDAGKRPELRPAIARRRPLAEMGPHLCQASTISRRCGAIETTIVRSSGSGSSSVANWVSSSEGGMKCPLRAASRRAIRSHRLSDTRCGHRVGCQPGYRDRRVLSAEHATGHDCRRAASRRSRRQGPSSQGQRSSSVSGSPLCIFSMLDCGWNQSPASKIQFSRCASVDAIVLLPQPDTPITGPQKNPTLAKRFCLRILSLVSGASDATETADDAAQLPLDRERATLSLTAT
jgi:hypothetical protein